MPTFRQNKRKIKLRRRPYVVRTASIESLQWGHNSVRQGQDRRGHQTILQVPSKQRPISPFQIEAVMIHKIRLQPWPQGLGAEASIVNWFCQKELKLLSDLLTINYWQHSVPAKPVSAHVTSCLLYCRDTLLTEIFHGISKFLNFPSRKKIMSKTYADDESPIAVSWSGVSWFGRLPINHSAINEYSWRWPDKTKSMITASYKKKGKRPVQLFIHRFRKVRKPVNLKFSTRRKRPANFKQ